MHKLKAGSDPGLFSFSSFRDGPKDQTRNLEIPGSTLRVARNDERKKAGIAPGLQFFASLVISEVYFASARFGGVAGHDFTRVS